MDMRFRILVLMVTAIFSFASGLVGPKADVRCTKEKFKACPVACVSLCDNEEFLRKNAVLCSVALTRSQADPADCSNLEYVAVPEQGNSDDSVVSTDCNSLPELEKKICEAGFPSCAGSVPALKKKSEILAAETKTELLKYSEILSNDFDPESPQELCKFRVEDLKRFYQQSSGDPEKLTSFSGRYLNLIKCVQQVESWINTYPISSTLIKEAVKTIKPEIEKLKSGMGETNRNVNRIGALAPVLEKLIIVHSFLCPQPEKP